MKFIAWNRKTGEWLDRNEDLFMSSDGVLYYMNSFVKTLTRVNMNHVDVWEHTGFKDTEGEDIYVGDVVVGIASPMGHDYYQKEIMGRVVLSDINKNYGIYVRTQTETWRIEDMYMKDSLDTLNCRVIGHVSSDKYLGEKYDG